MPIGELCIRQVVVASRHTPVSEAAQLMRRYHVGDIVVTEADGKHVPVGIVTDRDIVVGILAPGLDASRLSLGDIIADDLVTVSEQEGVFETIRLMRAKGVRRIPVVDSDQALVGIIAVDDLVELLAEELGELSKLISKEQRHEVEMRV